MSTTTRFAFLVLFVSLVACGDGAASTDGGVDASADGGVDASRDAGPVVHLAGHLVVHTTQTANPPPGAPINYTSVRVIVGDGSRFDAPTDAVGDVTFDDPSLEGPVDVTVVSVSTTGTVSALTVGDVDVPELTLGGVYTTGGFPVVSTLSGHVTGFDVGHQVDLTIYAMDGFFGGTTAAADGSFSLELHGALGTHADVLVTETDPATSSVVRLAFALDVAFDAATVTRDIALDHPVNLTLAARAVGFEPYTGDPLAGGIHFERATRPLFYAAGTTSGAVVSLPTPALTPPFADVTRRVSLSVGSCDAPPNGCAAAALVPDVSATSVDVSLPAPARLTSPPIGPDTAPPTAPLAGLRFAWTTDPAAAYVVGHMRGRAPAAPNPFEWRFFMAASRGAFTPFVLPADTAPITTPPAGLYEVGLASQWRVGVTRVTDSFDEAIVNVTPGTGPLSWSTSVRGRVMLE